MTASLSLQRQGRARVWLGVLNRIYFKSSAIISFGYKIFKLFSSTKIVIYS
jgi:hypothetical protein